MASHYYIQYKGQDKEKKKKHNYYVALKEEIIQYIKKNVTSADLLKFKGADDEKLFELFLEKKLDIDYKRCNIICVVDDYSWITFVHQYMAEHRKEIVTKEGKRYVGTHPLNDNIAPKTLVGMIKGSIEV